MKVPRIVLCAALAIFASGANPASAATTATVHLHQIDRSGIQADLALVDDGTSLNATGSGTGFVLGKFKLAEV